LIDKGKVGNFAMEAIDSIAEGFEDLDAELEVSHLMLVATIRSTDDEGRAKSYTEAYADDPDPIIAIGMARAAQLAVEEDK
jgi:hypothetical protein